MVRIPLLTCRIGAGGLIMAMLIMISPSISRADTDDSSVREHSGPVHSDVMTLITSERTDCDSENACPEDATIAKTVRGTGDSSSSSVSRVSSYAAEYTCDNGYSDSYYPCSNVNMYSHLTLDDLGGGSGSDGNDIWGWTDSSTGDEYVLAGLMDGTSLVDISDPSNPNVIAYIMSHDSTTTGRYWRDMKIYQDWVYIVCDSTSTHGLQYVHLPSLIANAESSYSSSGIYYLESSDSDNYQDLSVVNCHNVFVNEDTGYLYAVGCNEASGGLYVYDLSDPSDPTYAGSFSADGYTHDIQCVSYSGPDNSVSQGTEICFGYNEDSIAVINVEDKSNMYIIGRMDYDDEAYTHQGWIDESQTYLFMDDELDELQISGVDGTRTYTFDISDLSNPVLIDLYESNTHGSIDHNHYVKGDLLYQAHYRAGLRILDISNPNNLNEVAYFDTYVSDDDANFNGAWSVFPYFSSGVIAMQDIEKGLFLLSYDGSDSDDSDSSDSSDDSDSNDDDTTAPTSKPTDAPSCESDEFECDDDCCIPQSWKNDNYCDCGTNCEDEITTGWTCDNCGSDYGSTCDSIANDCTSYFYCNYLTSGANSKTISNDNSKSSSSSSNGSSSSSSNSNNNNIWDNTSFLVIMIISIIIFIVIAGYVIWKQFFVKKNQMNQHVAQPLLNVDNNDKHYLPPSNQTIVNDDVPAPEVHVY